MSVNEVKLKKATEAFAVRGSGPPTSRTFCLGDEDHTIGNALRHILIQNSSVQFAGYSVPHPSEPIVHIRVQTVPTKQTQKDHEQQTFDNNEIKDEQHQQEQYTATDALRISCQTLYEQCEIVMEQLEEILPEVRDDRIRIENILFGDDEGEEGIPEENKKGGMNEDVEFEDYVEDEVLEGDHDDTDMNY
jgi:DNA-directed RNA polymerases I and III subunit RPAC2